jgi:hypothetical protein
VVELVETTLVTDQREPTRLQPRHTGMRRVGGLVLVALAVAGCAGEVAQCGACEDPRVVRVLMTGQAPTDLPVRVCIEGLGCQVSPASSDPRVAFTLGDGADRAALDGHRVSVSAQGGGPDPAAFTGQGRLRHTAASGDCGCESLSGRVAVRQDH